MNMQKKIQDHHLRCNLFDWMHANCKLCARRFESEGDMEFHVQRFHEYGEECALYPCEYCGYRAKMLMHYATTYQFERN